MTPGIADITIGPMAGQVVLVTGGTDGIGQATAIGLAEHFSPGSGARSFVA